MTTIIQKVVRGQRAARSMALAAGVAAALLLSGCGAFGGGGDATPLPTRTPLPTFTPTPAGGAPAAQQPAAQQPAAQQPAAQQPAAQQPAAQQPAAQQPAAQQPAQSNAQTNTAQAGATQGTTQTAAAPAAGNAVTNTTATTGTGGTTAAAPASTPAPAGAELVTNDIVNIRQGPGTSYGLVGTAQTGTKFRITGKNQAGDWWQIDYNGKPGWIFGQLVNATNANAVALAQNIPAPPPTPVPAPPTNTPAPAAAAPANTPAPASGGGGGGGGGQASAPVDSGNYPFTLGQNVNCQPNAGVTYFKGFTRDSKNQLINGVCIHIAFSGPRTTKCSGCDGVGDGNWGFSPFGQGSPPKVTVEIFVVQCPGSLPPGGQTEQSGFGDLTPQSPKWVRTLSQGEQCEGITFYRK